MAIYTIGAEGKIKINEARENYFFAPNVTLWGHFFALAHKHVIGALDSLWANQVDTRNN